MRKKFSIIIVTFKSEEIIEKCLKHIYQNNNIIIIDNSNNYNYKKIIKKKYPKIIYITSKKNLGYGAANNLGIAKSKNTNVLILNPDAIITKNNYTMLENYINNIKNYGILLPLIKNKNSEIIFKKKINKPQIANYKDIGKGYVSGCAMLINKEKLKKIGFFDEKIFLYKEETDLIKRCSDSNIKVYMLPRCHVRHIGTSSHNNSLNFEMELSRNWHWMWSNFYFYKKNFNFLYAVIKMSKNIFTSSFKIILYFFINKKKYLIYKHRLFGLFSSILNLKSYYRPKV
jgi:N-acetylglucosaminyl-diphospho-decaprenol L-rhamnosyltransferase